METIDNIKQVFNQKKYIAVTVITALIIGYFMFYFTNYDLIEGNMGHLYANLQVLLQLLFSVLIGINVSLLFYQINTASAAKGAGSTAIGSILGIIVSGCPSCGITLASYIGLASFFSFLPFYGIEIKIIGVFVLVYSTFSISKRIGKCEISEFHNQV